MHKLSLFGLLSLLVLTVLLAEEMMGDEYDIFEDSSIVQSQERNSSDTQEETVQSKEEDNKTLSTIETNNLEAQVSAFDEAIKTAKEEEKIIMLVFRAIDCNYCDRMETETLVDDEVKEALEKDFITLHYNQDLEALPLGFQEGMTPNFIFVDKEENILQMYPGMRTPEQFLEALNEILAM